MEDAAEVERVETAWYAQIWGGESASLLDNPAQHVEFGPSQLQIWAARLVDTTGLCVAPTAPAAQGVKVDGSQVVVLTSGANAKSFHEKQESDARINFDTSINGFYVCLNPTTKWNVSWPAQVNQQGSSVSYTRSSVASEDNSFQTHESYEIGINLPQSEDANDVGQVNTCATVAMGYQVVITVLFQTSEPLDLQDNRSNATSQMSDDGKYRIAEVKVDCNFLNQSGLVVMKVCAAPRQFRACKLCSYHIPCLLRSLYITTCLTRMITKEATKLVSSHLDSNSYLRRAARTSSWR